MEAFSTLLALPPPFNMIVLIVALTSAASVIKGITKQVRVFADNEADRRLKRDMIESGLSVDEAAYLAETKVYRRSRDQAAGAEATCKG